MGVLTALRMKRDQEAITASLPGNGDPSTFPIVSPWSGSGNLERVFYQDVYGTDGPPISSRRAAMAIPAIARARNLLCSAIARQPLRVADATGVLPLEQQPTWLYRTNRVSPRQQIVWTVDDLIFYGWSCWWVERGADGFPLHRERLNQDAWSIDADLNIQVNGQVVKPDSNGLMPAVLIPGYHEGILSFGRDGLEDTKQLYWIVRDRLANPVPITELHQKSGMKLDKTEREELLDSWRAARQKAGGNVGYTSEEIELIAHGGDGDATLLIEARNAAAVDMARLVGVSAGMLDATTPKASLNYETQSGRNQEFRDLDLAGYTSPVEDRLSMDDMVPAGKRVVFDATDYTAPVPSPTGAELED